MIDARMVEVPVQRFGKEEREKIDAGGKPKWKPSKRRQKDTEAKWTRKGSKSLRVSEFWCVGPALKWGQRDD